MRLYLLLLLLVLVVVPAFAAQPTHKAVPADDGRIVAYTCWTPTYLYFAFRVDTPVVVGNQTLPLSQPWLDDAVAVYLNLNPSNQGKIDKDCLRVVISAAGGVTAQRGDSGEWRDDPSWFQLGAQGTIRYGVKVLGKLNDMTGKSQGYQVTLGLSWELLGVNPPFLAERSAQMPAIGFAMAGYSQGESQVVSCWPQKLNEADLAQPAKWGNLQFSQSWQPVASQEPLATATLTPSDPTIDGELKFTDWLTAGVQVFHSHRAATTVTAAAAPHAHAAAVAANRPKVSLLAAEYLLTPPGNDAIDQPLQPAGPWLAPDSPLYHALQIADVKRAGIDALAVVIPVKPETRDVTRQRLAALVTAVAEYDEAHASIFQTSTPLLLPMFDLSATTLDLHGEDGRAMLAAWLDDFYRLVPPQYRMVFNNASGTLCYPVILTAPSATVSGNDSFLGEMNAHFTARWGMPIGWLLDQAWKTAKTSPDVLCYCHWGANTPLQISEGFLSTALITPGSRRFASRTFFSPKWGGL